MPATSHFEDELTAELARIEIADLRRYLTTIDGASEAQVTVDGTTQILLSSNNYLGLATHPTVVAAAHRALDTHGCGAGSSRLIAGHSDLHAATEARLARFKGTEAAVLFPTGYQANVGTISTLVGHGDHVFSDELNHASIIDGCRLSRATVHVYPHADADALAAALARTPPSGRRLVVTDSVFSMDGDCAPLDTIATVAERHGAVLMVDEAHATGVLGPHGAGLVEELGLGQRVPVQMGTLGKALGGAGAYVAGSRGLIDLIVNRARSFVFTTGLAPAAVAAAHAAIDVVVSEPERRDALRRNVAFLRAGLEAQGFTLGGETHILPLVLGDNRRTVGFAAALRRHGVLVHAIRPPTVPAGTARLRITPMATHTPAQLERVLAGFAAVARETDHRS